MCTVRENAAAGVRGRGAGLTQLPWEAEAAAQLGGGGWGWGGLAAGPCRRPPRNGCAEGSDLRQGREDERE